MHVLYLISDVYMCTIIDQKSHYLPMAHRTSTMKCSPAILYMIEHIYCNDVSTKLAKDQFNLILIIDECPILDKNINSFCVSIHTGSDQSVVTIILL